MAATMAAELATALDTGETGGERRAALLLHAMAPADRGWVLAALAPQQRAQLESLLGELEALGMERDQALVTEAIALAQSRDSLPASPVPDGLPPDDDRLPADLRALDDGQLRRLASLLRAEPGGLTVEVLRLGRWPWQARLLELLGEEGRHALAPWLSAESGAPAPPALRAALLEALRAHLARPARAPSGAATGTAWLDRLSRSFLVRVLPGRSVRT